MTCVNGTVTLEISTTPNITDYSWSFNGGPAGGTATLVGQNGRIVTYQFNDVVGSYTFQANMSIDGSSCGWTEPYNVDVLPLPVVGITSGGDVCEGETGFFNFLGTRLSTFEITYETDGETFTANGTLDSLGQGIIEIPNLSNDVTMTSVTVTSPEGCVNTITTNETITVVPQEIGTTNTTTICNAGSSSATTLNLFANLAGNPPTGGTWSETTNSNVNFSNPNAVSFAGVSLGDYTFLYTVDGNPCQDVVYTLTVTVIECDNCTGQPDGINCGSNQVCCLEICTTVPIFTIIET